jgi:hypothetical protein
MSHVCAAEPGWPGLALQCEGRSTKLDKSLIWNIAAAVAVTVAVAVPHRANAGTRTNTCAEKYRSIAVSQYRSITVPWHYYLLYSPTWTLPLSPASVAPARRALAHRCAWLLLRPQGRFPLASVACAPPHHPTDNLAFHLNKGRGPPSQPAMDPRYIEQRAPFRPLSLSTLNSQLSTLFLSLSLSLSPNPHPHRHHHPSTSKLLVTPSDSAPAQRQSRLASLSTRGRRKFRKRGLSRAPHPTIWRSS